MNKKTSSIKTDNKKSIASTVSGTDAKKRDSDLTTMSTNLNENSSYVDVED